MLSNAKSKTVIYRGGVVVFSIPQSWREEYEPSGGGMFYEDKPDSATLRLNVLGFESESTPADQMAATAFRGGVVEKTHQGFSLRREEKNVGENGEDLLIYRWEVAVPVQPKQLRLAIFSYTILANQKSDPHFVAEAAQVDASIRHASFSQEPGEAGDFK